METEYIKEQLMVLEQAPPACEFCSESYLVRDVYGTGDSPSEWECRKDECPYSKAYLELVDIDNDLNDKYIVAIDNNDEEKMDELYDSIDFIETGLSLAPLWIKLEND